MTHLLSLKKTTFTMMILTKLELPIPDDDGPKLAGEMRQKPETSLL